MFNLFNKIDNSQYGGFIVSKNITNNGKKAKYCYRDKMTKKELNGWTILSEIDDDRYAKDPKNFEIVSATTMFKFCPFMRELFEAPYGTDLLIQYGSGKIPFFYDMRQEKNVTLNEILKK